MKLTHNSKGGLQYDGIAAPLTMISLNILTFCAFEPFPCHSQKAPGNRANSFNQLVLNFH